MRRSTVQKIAGGLRVTDQRFVEDCLRGMDPQISTMRSEIGRALRKKIPLIETVPRLSRMASSKHFDEERLRGNLIAEVAPLTTRELPIVAMDRTDLAKP